MEFSKKLESLLPEGWKESIESMDSNEIKLRIYECEVHLYTIDKAKKEDQELAKAREALKEASASYREGKAIENAKIKYCMLVMEDRGINITQKRK